VGARSGSFFFEILMSDVLVVNCELRDRYGDVGHHLLFQDAPSFIQKYISLIHVWSSCIYVRKCLLFIDFHVLALPGFSRADHDVRLEKSAPTAPISSSVITM
jgi:hypothetical protein